MSPFLRWTHSEPQKLSKLAYGALQKHKNESSNYFSLCYHFVDQNCYHNNYQLGDVLRDLPLGSR